MQHLTPVQILAYAFDECGDADLPLVDGHIAQCAECLDRVRGALYLSSHAAEVVGGWTAAQHGAALRRARLAAALRTAAEREPGILARAASWLSHTGAEASAAARLALDRARGVGLASAAWMGEGWSSNLRPALQGVASPDADAATRSLNEGMRLLDEGDSEGALDSALQAARLDARTARSTTLEVNAPEGTLYRVVVDARRGRVAVIRRPRAAELAGTLAMLIPSDESLVPLVSRFELVTGADYMLAEFESVPDGEYALETEPVPGGHSEEGGAWTP